MNRHKNTKRKITGDESSFIKNWKKREEKAYNHWTQKEPQNQVQLAFRMHWEVFVDLMKDKSFNKGKKCLEVGCGRGSISAYFNKAGFDCTLLDISPEIIREARKIFDKNEMKADFIVGDANKLPFTNNSFDVVVSIGLLEHFENIGDPIKEQVRVLGKGGLFLGYIVPEYSQNIQQKFEWINDILRIYKESKNPIIAKEKIFRSDKNSKHYTRIMKKFGLMDVKASGFYPLPMISHSIEFPFSLMPEQAEKRLVAHFNKILAERRKKSVKHPWLCKEGSGQAFLVWGFKK